MTTEETRVTRTPAPELSPAEAARVAAFDAAQVPSECDPERVETVARAIFTAETSRTMPPYWTWEAEPPRLRDEYRRLAAAAIAALPPTPAEEAVKRVEMVRAVREAAWREGYVACYRGEQKHNPYRAALASPAPAPRIGSPACNRCGGEGWTGPSDVRPAVTCDDCNGTGVR